MGSLGQVPWLSGKGKDHLYIICSFTQDRVGIRGRGEGAVGFSLMTLFYLMASSV